MENKRTKVAGNLASSTSSLSDLAVARPEVGKDIFLRRPVVEARTGLPRSSIYERIAAGTFPKPVPLGGRSVGWLETEIADWQKHRIAERDSKRASRKGEGSVNPTGGARG